MKFVIRLFRHILSQLSSWQSVACPDKEDPTPIPWKANKITAEIRADNVYLKIGKYLHLEQRLNPGECGWTMSKIEIPDSWAFVEVSFEGDDLVLLVKDIGEYRINANNIGPLSYSILSAGKGKKPPEERLEAIWAEFARTSVANTSLQPTSVRDAAFRG